MDERKDDDLDLELEDAEDITGQSGKPEDDPEFDGYVRVADLRPPVSSLRAAIEDAVKEWPIEVPLRGPEPKVLRFIRRDENRFTEWRASPICLRCTLPGSRETVGWGERGVLCFICVREAERREAVIRAMRGGRSPIEWLMQLFRPRRGRPRDLGPAADFLRRFEDAKATLRRRSQRISWRSVALEMGGIGETTLRDKRERYGLTLDG